MQRSTPISAWVAILIAVTSSTACDATPSPRPGADWSSEDRGQWQPRGKADELATCEAACGTRAEAGCWCDDACEQWGDCCPDKRDLCDEADEPGDDATEGDEDDDTPSNDEGPKACYLETCLATHGLPPNTSGFNYPSALNGSSNYRPPVSYLDLHETSGSTLLSPNFRLDEVTRVDRARWAVVQPHAIAKLQALRDQLGALVVNSGYRSPTHNAAVGGATHSRHMFGDAFDLRPLSASLTALRNACSNHGGTPIVYTNHIHCDWRSHDLDPSFFGAAGPQQPEDAFLALDELGAELEEANGVFTAPATGFDEGEPLRRWTALAADGAVLETAIGVSFTPPVDTRTLRVTVGDRIELEAEL